MKSERKFYRAIVQYEILSEEPIGAMSLSDIEYETTDGHMSGHFLETKHEELDSVQMAAALQNQGSDPEFFQLDESGQDLDEEIQ
jgi:hypothetical protein